MKMKTEIKDLMKTIEKISMRFFRVNFRQRQFWDRSKKKWKRRKNNPKTGRPPDHPPLEDTKHLFKSFTSTIKGYQINIKNTAKYAGFHNDGVQGLLPQRQFLGHSEELEDRQVKIIDKFLDKKFQELVDDFLDDFEGR